MRFRKYLFILIIILGISYSSNVFSSSISFDFYTYKGKKVNLQNFRGKYVLLNLFTSYCSLCLAELKILNDLNHTCKIKEYEIISLMIDKEGIPLLPQIVSSHNITYTVGIAPSNIFKFFPDFSLAPTTYVLNQNGVLVEEVVGYKNLKDWIKLLNKYVSCN